MTNFVTVAPIVEKESVEVRIRLQDPVSLNQVLADEIDEIYLTVYELRGMTRIWEDSLSIPDHIDDAGRTDGWIGTGEYHFFDEQPSHDWMEAVEGGRTYRIQYEFRLKSEHRIRRAVIVPMEEWLDG